MLNKFVDWIMSLSCDHEWECLLNGERIYNPVGADYHKWVYRCKKCGKTNIIKSK